MEFGDFEQAFHRHFSADPNARLSLGVLRDLGELPDPSAEHEQRRLAEARELLRELAALRARTTDFEPSLDLELAELELERELHDGTYTFGGRTSAQQRPSAGHDIGEGIFLLFVNDPRPDQERLDDITARLAQVPQYLRALLGRLAGPHPRWVEIDLEQVAGLPSLFATIADWAEGLGLRGLTELQRARREAEAELVAYAARLRALPVGGTLHVGDATARRIVELRGIDLSLEELHGIARDFLRSNGERLGELRHELVARYGLDPGTDVEGLHQHLERVHRLEVRDGDFEVVLERYRREHRRILAWIAERDLFPIPADQELVILRTPAFMAPSIPAGAMMPPPPFRSGIKRSFVYLTLSEELLAEHTELGIPGMMVHEGIPGHHLQLAHAASHPSIVRRHVNAMDQAEGWTTMLEDYVLDQGYMGEQEPEARFVALRDIARIGARVAIDLFFMTGERGYLEVGVDCELGAADPFEAAGSLLRAVTGFTAGRTRAELNWYSQERGYPLSYLCGNHLVWKLRRDVEAAQAGRLEPLELDRTFHRAFLAAGNMPVRFLRRSFEQRGLLTARG